VALINVIENLISEIDSTYASLYFSEATTLKLNSIIKKYLVPHAVKLDTLHISLFTTDKPNKIPKKNYDIDIELNDMKNFTVMTWYSNKKQFPDKQLLVIEFTSFQLVKFRNLIINTLQIPLSSIPPLSNKFHITLSYNIGDKSSYPITKDIINPFPLEITKLKLS